MTILSAARRTRAQASLDVPRSVSDGLYLHIPRKAFTLDGFRAWVLSDEFPEKLRVTYVDGEIYLDMSKEELQTHVVVKGEIARGIMNLSRETKLGQFYPDGVLITNKAAGVSNNPDGVFVRWESLEKGRVRFVAPEGSAPDRYMEIEGTPDWVLEVVSESSVRKDTELLRVAYYRAGIPEYWLIDARAADILFQILVWRKTGYASAPSRRGWQRSPLFRRGFRLVRQAGRSGLWEYTLQIRSK